jgi:hypothetical protein
MMTGTLTKAKRSAAGKYKARERIIENAVVNAASEKCSSGNVCMGVGVTKKQSKHSINHATSKGLDSDQV